MQKVICDTNGASTLSLLVRRTPENEQDEWNLFVDREGGSFFHYFEWKYIYEKRKSDVYIPLMIRNDHDEIIGIFPLVSQSGPVYPSLSSLPEGPSDGFLLRSSLTSHESDAVIRAFLDFIDSEYSGTHAFFTLRHHLPYSSNPAVNAPVFLRNGYHQRESPGTDLPCTFVLHLENPFNERVFASMSRLLRNRIRHAHKTGARVVIDDDFTYFPDVARMHMNMVKKFGITTQMDDYNQILRVFRNKIKLFVCLAENEPISAILAYYTPTTVYGAMGPYSPASKPYHNTILPLCTTIRHACNSGYQYFDMGITLTPSLADFKKRFGGRKIPLIIYQKKFSRMKMLANKVSDAISGRH